MLQVDVGGGGGGGGADFNQRTHTLAGRVFDPSLHHPVRILVLMTRARSVRAAWRCNKPSRLALLAAGPGQNPENPRLLVPGRSFLKDG